jgi:SAM-dependent methyltransferase
MSDYDPVAGEYARRIYHELDGKPLDRALLDRFAASVGAGRVCDVGCGPGHVARYLHERRADVFGIDLSPRMVDVARRLNPGIEFAVGDMRALDLADGSLAGLVAFYSILHLSEPEIPGAFAELRRVLAPGGLGLIAVHRGTDVVHADELWGLEVSLDFRFFEPDELSRHLVGAGFAVEEIVERPPYEGVEVETDRLYVFARSGRTSMSTADRQESGSSSRSGTKPPAG